MSDAQILEFGQLGDLLSKNRDYPNLNEGDFYLYVASNQNPPTRFTEAAIVLLETAAWPEPITPEDGSIVLEPFLLLPDVIDIVAHAHSTRKRVNEDDLIRALNYYDENDAFIEWDQAP